MAYHSFTFRFMSNRLQSKFSMVGEKKTEAEKSVSKHQAL